MKLVELAARNASAALRETMNVRTALLRAVEVGELDSDEKSPHNEILEAARETERRALHLAELLKKQQ